MKKQFEVPSIEKISFEVSDSNLCAAEIVSAPAVDTGAATENVTAKISE